MSDEFYTAGIETALEDLQLEKVALAALAGSLGRGVLSAGKSLFGGAKSLGSKGMAAYGKNVSQPLTAQGRKAEQWLGSQATQRLSPGAAATSKRLIKGVPGEVLRQGAGGAALGGVIGGASGAATAEPGSRLSGALSGAASGAKGFAAMGAGAGLAGGLTRNVGRMGMGRLAKSQGLRRNAAAVNQQLKPGMGNWWQNVKNVGTGTGAMGRAGSLGAAATGTTALGADLYATTKLDEMMQGPSEQPRQLGQPGGTRSKLRTVTASDETAPDKRLIPTSIVGSALGGTVAGLGTSAVLQTLKAKKLLPSTALAATGLQIAPSLASTAGSLAGFSAGQKVDQQTRPNQLTQLKKLEGIDLDKLQRYYKASP